MYLRRPTLIKSQARQVFDISIEILQKTLQLQNGCGVRTSIYRFSLDSSLATPVYTLIIRLKKKKLAILSSPSPTACLRAHVRSTKLRLVRV